MFDLFAIFTKGGILLWHYQQHATVSVVRVVNELISQVLLLERFHLATFSLGQLLLEFKLDNKFQLIFVVAYQKIAKLMEIDKLIENLFTEFRNLFSERLKLSGYFDASNFDTIFKPILKNYEIDNSISISSGRTMKTFTESKKFSKLSETQKEKTFSALEQKETNSPDTMDTAQNAANHESPEDTSLKHTQYPRGIQGERVGGMRRGRGRSKNHTDSKSSLKTVPKKHPKVGRTWDGQISEREVASLNFSKEERPEQPADASSYVTDPRSAVGAMRGDLSGIDTIKETESKQQPKVSRFMSMLGGLTGSKPIGKDRLAPALEAVKEHLITKNVAAEIAENLCTSVGEQVEGRTLSSFTTVRAAVQQALRDSLSHILMPRRNINVLREILTKRKHSDNPYVITFCGVNGVGKSTSLAKVCFWLLENDFRVLIAACDTFRSGAIEQLLTHTKCLQSMYPGVPGSERVTLYSNKTNKDASSVATEGILMGMRGGYDVIMVDTAGRMQDNQPLMQALGKLIHRNVPDLVLFVGEALVGNEGVDQLQKFNQSLIDYSSGSGDLERPSLIDGILLTKFDTVDDKVGAAISMTYATGHPIVFVGTGQMYTDLKSFSPDSVMNTLLK